MIFISYIEIMESKEDLKISQEDLEKANMIIREIQNYYQKKIVGQTRLGLSLLTSLIEKAV